MRKHPLIITIGVYLSLLALGSQASTDTSKDDLTYRSAFYNYTLEQYVPARTALLQAAKQTSKPSIHRQMLLARIRKHLKKCAKRYFPFSVKDS